MEWSGEGIIIGTRKHGETSLIIELMTRERGRHLGLVRGGRSRKMQPILQPGNKVSVTWRARLDEHLGTYLAEPVTMTAARLMESSLGVNGIQLLGSHLRLLAERDPHPQLYDVLEILLQHLSEAAIVGPMMVKLEIRLLEELGFGLDLTRCAGTGTKENLIYVSPKSGQAVSADAGAPWADKMLPLPAFLTQRENRRCSSEELQQAFRMTGFFLDRHIYAPRGIKPPEERDGFLRAASRAL